jgi:hypothetical protein
MLVERFLKPALCAALLCSALGLAPAQQQPPFPVPSATVTPVPDPAMVARAKAVYAELAANKIDASELRPEAAVDMTPAKMKQAADFLAPLGTPVTFEQQRTASQGGITAYMFELTFGNSTKLDFIYAIDAKGKIASLRVTPSP